MLDRVQIRGHGLSLSSIKIGLSAMIIKIGYNVCDKHVVVECNAIYHDVTLLDTLVLLLTFKGKATLTITQTQPQNDVVPNTLPS